MVDNTRSGALLVVMTLSLLACGDTADPVEPQVQSSSGVTKDDDRGGDGSSDDKATSTLPPLHPLPPAPPIGVSGLTWSSAGPISGKHCIQITEPSDPNTW